MVKSRGDAVPPLVLEFGHTYPRYSLVARTPFREGLAADVRTEPEKTIAEVTSETTGKTDEINIAARAAIPENGCVTVTVASPSAQAN